MPVIEALNDVELKLQVGAVRVPLAPLMARRRQSNADGEAPQGRAFVPPTIVAPDLGASLQLMPVRSLALRELIEQASSGHVRVVLPLPREKLGKGPFKIDLGAGHEAIIELEVEDNAIVRDQVHGSIEPAVDLPLGTSFQGLYLDDSGDIIASIDNFIDINLTRWSGRVPRIPPDLDTLLSMVFDRPRSEDTGDADKKKLDLSGLRVFASNVRPHGTRVLEIGGIGRVRLGQSTLLDIEYSAERLAVRGRAELVDAFIEGSGFALHGVRGTCQLAFELVGPRGARTLSLTISDVDLCVESGILRTRNGSHLHIGSASIDDGDLTLRVAPEAGLELAARARHVCGDIAGGQLVFEVGGQRTAVHLSRTRAEGVVEVTGKRVALDLDVASDELRVNTMTADLGVVQLAATDVSAGGRGRFVGATDQGFRFAGELEASAEVGGTTLTVDELTASLDTGSRAVLRVADFALTPLGLNELHASGGVHLRLHAGRLPLGRAAAIDFRHGAEGEARLREIRFDADDRFPTIVSSLRLDASSDPLTIGTTVELPPGDACVVADVNLAPDGTLSVEQLTVTLSLAGDA